MPLIISDDNKQVSAVSVSGQQVTLDTKLYSPKFFHGSILTGRGGQTKGLLNENHDPKMYKNGYPTNVNPNLTPGTTYNKDIKIYDIPCYIISPSLWDEIEKFDRPEIGEMTAIAKKGNSTVYLTMPVHAIQVEEKQIPGPAGSSVTQTARDMSACMHMFLFKVEDPTVKEHTQAMNLDRFTSNKGNCFYRDIIYNIFTPLLDVESRLTKAGWTVDKDAMNDFVQNYSLYIELCKAAEKWLNKTEYFIADVLVKNINNKTNGKPDPLWTGTSRYYSHQFSVFETLSMLEKYSIPLDQYQKMYDKMEKYLNPDILADICKANLNLRLSNTLQHMNQNRANLQYCPCNTTIQTKIPYSSEQTAAITSTSPLTLVQSGAGTGKSTVILGRIDHMIANGIDPKDITVLSFTNAAADHITDLKPTIHSMTIASMLHTIYANNFPSHQLSSLATIINSLEIYFDPAKTNMTATQERFINDFRYILERLMNNNEYTRANNFVEDHLDEVIAALDTIEQTSLELESIICYQKMDTLTEPDETKTKHLIIDEVQDNSIAEFIYSIKYTDKHQCSMYIVGDCSQTLYEFRSSNPKALNVLENSGVFATYKLQTNYRSNQEILDFANILLGNIEANQYANIQLKANSLKPVTLQSFQDAVKMQYTRMLNKSPNAYDNLYAHSVAIDTKEYVEDKLNKGEQVCILAPARKTLGAVTDYIRKIYYPNLPKDHGGPNDEAFSKKVVSLIPKRQYDNAIFSKFIAKYWDTISYTPPLGITVTIRREILSKVTHLTYKRNANLQIIIDTINRMMDEFENEYGARIMQWQNQVQMSVMTQQQLLDELRKLMLSFEIKRNNMAQALMSAKNAKAKQTDDVENADFVISTIHSAKGLEFDNVIIYYASESESSIDEATKRMYYVAFTRAKKTEYIFAYDTMARPKVQGDYEKIIADLTKKAKAGTASGGNDDDDDNDATITPPTNNIVVKIHPELEDRQSEENDDTTMDEDIKSHFIGVNDPYHPSVPQETV